MRLFGLKMKAALLIAAGMLAGMPAASQAQPDTRASQPTVSMRGPAAQRTPTETERAARRALEQRLAELGRGFDGLVGIAVRDVDSDYAAAWNGNRLFPQQSVSKFWVALTTLEAVDRGRLSLDQRVTLRRDDLTLFHQPIAALVDGDGFTTTIEDLLTRAITQSDCTANDFLLWKAGGPEAVRSYLDGHDLTGVRFGPGERLMQSAIAGVTWNQAMSIGRGFERARAAVPAATRRRLFNNYVEDPVDGASPLGVTNGLARLQRGELLSPQSTRRLLSIMARTRTGPQRLTGGLDEGWNIAHKTGTGQVFGGEQAGYNDVGIITAPDGHRYALAVLIGRTSVPNIVRMRLMQNVTRAAIQFHEDRE